MFSTNLHSFGLSIMNKSILAFVAFIGVYSSLSTGWIIRNARSNPCTFKVTESGEYRLSGMAGRKWYQPHCSVFIQGPVGTRISINWTMESVNCDKATLQVLNGWRIFDWFSLKSYSLPDENSQTENGTWEDLCSNRPYVDGKFETSQNFGQVLYTFGRSDSVLVNINFIPNEKMCNVLLSTGSTGTYHISNGGKWGVCTWYIAGAALVKFHWINGTDQCNQNGNRLLFRSSGISWDQNDVKIEQSECNTGQSNWKMIMPCKYNRMELHTGWNEESSVSLALERPSEMEIEPFKYYCYSL